MAIEQTMDDLLEKLARREARGGAQTSSATKAYFEKLLYGHFGRDWLAPTDPERAERERRALAARLDALPEQEKLVVIAMAIKDPARYLEFARGTPP